MANPYLRMARLRTAQELRNYLDQTNNEFCRALQFDEHVEQAPDGPLAQPYTLRAGRTIGNRFCILPMEGWDGETDGNPTELTLRRWINFGRSGAKLIWGGEAVAVRHDGRANPNQLMIQEHTLSGLERLRSALLQTHTEHFGRTDDLLLGLQLTHSGRFARPNEKKRLEQKILYHHPLLDQVFGTDPNLPVMTDGEIEALIDDFVLAARRAWDLGFDFVDLKHCHGYLGHEFLSAHTRPGPYGGSFENRTRFLRTLVAGIRRDAPGLQMGVRFSAFDFPPFRPGPDGVGRALDYRDESGRYPFAFGHNPADPLQIDLSEPQQFLAALDALDIELVNQSAGSPYYNPHTMRPAYFPPSDGYLPPEDPLVGVGRMVAVQAALKKANPRMALVGSGYSYLQEWLPNVGQHSVRTGGVDFVGMGRMTLAYPEMPADVLAGRTLDRKRICRTFSDCTTAPRNGMVSGCYPLDDYYKNRPEAELLAGVKAKA